MLHDLKKSMYAMMGNRLIKRYGEMVPDQPEPIEVPSRWVEPHKRARIHLGLYEKDECALVAKYLNPELDTVELGCGVGVVSSKVCRQLNQRSRYVGVEGNPELVEVATRNLKRFPSIGERCIEHAVVVGRYEADRNRNFFITPGNFHSSSIAGGNAIEEVEVVVPEISLSELLRRHDFGHYQLVADVEGAELEVVQHDAAALANCQQMIIELHPTELNGNPVSIDNLAKTIRGLGFREATVRGEVFVFQRD